MAISVIDRLRCVIKSINKTRALNKDYEVDQHLRNALVSVNKLYNLKLETRDKLGRWQRTK